MEMSCRGGPNMGFEQPTDCVGRRGRNGFRLGVGSTSITATSEGQSGSVLLTVTPPVATSFGLVGGIPPVVPIPLSAGSAITPALVLRATTQSGIPVPGVRIVASISPAGATLAGSTSVSTDATGTGTFSNLVVNGAPGSYALMFTADGIQGAINFAVVLSAPSVVTRHPLR